MQKLKTIACKLIVDRGESNSDGGGSNIIATYYDNHDDDSNSQTPEVVWGLAALMALLLPS
jgi:hypothetical protein